MVEWKQSEASLAWEIYTASAHAVLVSFSYLPEYSCCCRLYIWLVLLSTSFTLPQNLTDLQQEACASSTSRDDDTSYRQPQYYFDELSTLCEAGHMDLAHLYLLSECKVRGLHPPPCAVLRTVSTNETDSDDFLFDTSSVPLLHRFEACALVLCEFEARRLR